ncbi:Bug family tripartite tricarboxylate transporter substrate binding protein [Pseudorhodoplanes sp.]|uniref:Bug family tripartite tricarboxylate transporter substrate binding protein n=1 Tax=Pseudorhodoplanes sp. TaxID=1934341 RepID=UPI003D09B73E
MLNRVLAGLLFLACGALPAATETYPTQPVRIIVAFSAGGSVDALARIIADKLTEKWKHQVFVENRPGALGNIGTTAAAKSPPDGYTLYLAASSIAINKTIAPIPNFDPLIDLDPVMLVAAAQDILIVPPNSKFKSAKDVIEFAKANPGALTYGTLGSSSSGNMAMAVFAQRNGDLKLKQIPYSQSSMLTGDVIAGRIDLFFPTTGAHIGVVQSGRERALGVSGKARAEGLPEIQTFGEQGINYPDATSWYALFAPKGTPADIVRKINRDLTEIMATPDFKAQEKKLGYSGIGGPPERLAEYLKEEIKNWAEIAKNPNFEGR